MTTEKFIEKNAELDKRIEEHKKKIDAEYNKACKAWIAKNSPVKRLSVYRLLKNGVRRRGYSRFIIYSLTPQFLMGHPILSAGGWWLNDDNIPSKWDTMTVLGVGNNALFELDPDQTALPHPDSKKAHATT